MAARHLTVGVQQDTFPESPAHGVCRPLQCAISGDAKVLLLGCTGRRISVYWRDKPHILFALRSSYNLQRGEQYFTDLAVASNGEHALYGDYGGDLHMFDTRNTVRKEKIRTRHDGGSVNSCSISSNYVLASFYHDERKECSMVLWRRCTADDISEHVRLVKQWPSCDVSVPDYHNLFSKCLVQDVENEPVLAYHVDDDVVVEKVRLRGGTERDEVGRLDSPALKALYISNYHNRYGHDVFDVHRLACNVVT